jgi:hypothetical protein
MKGVKVNELQEYFSMMPFCKKTGFKISQERCTVTLISQAEQRQMQLMMQGEVGFFVSFYFLHSFLPCQSFSSLFHRNGERLRGLHPLLDLPIFSSNCFKILSGAAK